MLRRRPAGPAINERPAIPDDRDLLAEGRAVPELECSASREPGANDATPDVQRHEILVTGDLRGERVIPALARPDDTARCAYCRKGRRQGGGRRAPPVPDEMLSDVFLIHRPVPASGARIVPPFAVALDAASNRHQPCPPSPSVERLAT